jgi:hypothetical protein
MSERAGSDRARGAPDRPEEEVWVVDRVEGRIAVLVEERGAEALDQRDSDSSPGPVVVEVAAELLGDHAVEGAVLRVPLGAVGEPAWEKASRDTAAEKARREEGEAAIERLKRRDPGGDIAL